jgi:hypothetical protein
MFLKNYPPYINPNLGMDLGNNIQMCTSELLVNCYIVAIIFTFLSYF